MKRIVTLSLLTLAFGAALAKLPAPVLSDEAKAKAAEAAAKTAHGNKVADFQLCRSMERVAVRYQAEAKKAGKEVKPPTETPPCADPGPFVYPPPAAATAAAPAPAATPAPAPAPAAAGAKAPAKKT
jgi:hypothetical protein